MLELSINAKTPASINGAFKKIKEMIVSGAVDKKTPVHLTLDAGVYKEIIKYNLSNPLVMESANGVGAANCIIQAENCEAFNKGLESRSVFIIGPNATTVTLKNFSIINTHIKSVDGSNTQADSAEAFTWNNTTGTLYAEGMRFSGRQNTLCLKGFSLLKKCYIEGDTDFIYGDCDTALFEECEIFVREDNRGDNNGYAVKSLSLANKKGFIFSECTFNAMKRRRASVYLYRTEGKGSATSPKNWDNAVILNCTISEIFNQELVWDDDMSLTVYPRGNAVQGLREYKTKTVSKTNKPMETDTTKRSIRAYTLTDDDYYKNYSSRFLLLKDTPFAAQF